MSTIIIENNLAYFLKTICLPCIFFTGIIGNLIVIAVFSRKKIQLNSNNFLRILAFNDILALLSLVIYYDSPIGINIINSTIYSCKYINSLSWFMSANSSWILLFVNFNRLVLLKYQQFLNFIKKNGSKPC